MARRLNDLHWVEERLSGGPPELVARARAVVALVPSSEPLPDRLARASEVALDHAVAKEASREAALDLLVADALVTLALEVQAHLDPAGLERFAVELRRAGAAAP
jgi:hypothetical protein